jgi:hypothetical protein
MNRIAAKPWFLVGGRLGCPLTNQPKTRLAACKILLVGFLVSPPGRFCFAWRSFPCNRHYLACSKFRLGSLVACYAIDGQASNTGGIKDANYRRF